jgi:hypothetical protein
LRADESKSKQYAKCTEQRAVLLFEEMFDIADETPERMETKTGTCIDTGDIQDKRVRIDIRKWALARMQPKKYSDVGIGNAANKPDDGNENEFLQTTIQLRDGIIEKHYRHYEAGHDWTLSQGSSRSGKTYNFLKWAYLQTRLGRFDLNIIAPSHKMLEHGAFNDIKKILSEYAPDIHIPERATKLNLHGSEWVFEVVASESEAKRNRVNVFVNEADGIPEIVANLLGRASGRKFIDFNPVKKFWADDKKNTLGTNLLESTWKDNPYLSESQ